MAQSSMKALLRNSGSGQKRQEGAPPPFLTKTYQMVEDPNTNEYISWSASENSFIIWKPADFAQDILPRYFKHSNLSSFVRQLNIYGFRKNHPDMWEFAHENFMRGREDLLREINRRKQSTASSQQIDVHQSNVADQVDKLKKDKDVLVMELVRQRQAQSQLQNNFKRLVNEISDWKNKQQETMDTVDKIVNFLGAVFSKTSITGGAEQQQQLMIAGRKKRRAGDPDSPETNTDSSPFSAVVDEPSTQLQTYTNGASNAAPVQQQPNPFAPGARLNLVPDVNISGQMLDNAFSPDAQNLLQELLSQRSLGSSKAVQSRSTRNTQRAARSADGAALVSGAANGNGHGSYGRRGAELEELAEGALSLSQFEDEDVDLDDDDDDEYDEGAHAPARPPAAAAAPAAAAIPTPPPAAPPARAASSGSWRDFLSSPGHAGIPDDPLSLDEALAPLPALSIKLEPGVGRAVAPPAASPAPDLVELSDELLADALVDAGIAVPPEAALPNPLAFPAMPSPPIAAGW